VTLASLKQHSDSVVEVIYFTPSVAYQRDLCTVAFCSAGELFYLQFDVFPNCHFGLIMPQQLPVAGDVPRITVCRAGSDRRHHSSLLQASQRCLVYRRHRLLSVHQRGCHRPGHPLPHPLQPRVCLTSEKQAAKCVSCGEARQALCSLDQIVSVSHSNKTFRQTWIYDEKNNSESGILCATSRRNVPN
jgi:hypothetical protein